MHVPDNHADVIPREPFTQEQLHTLAEQFKKNGFELTPVLAEELQWTAEENFLDDKSNGFQLESSLIRSAQALTRLCFVLAVTTLYLVSHGTEVVQQGKRRLVDPHWFRGSSYLKIGWNWVKLALTRGYDLITRVHLSSACDPEPARASQRQYQHSCQSRFAFELQDAA
jgi:hypothetical protein